MTETTASTYHPKFEVKPAETLNTLRKNMLIDGFDHVVDLEQSHGSWYVEARTGKEYLDFFTCIASMPIGMNHPKMVDPAFVEYLGKIAVNKPSNSDIYNTEYATFVKTFFELAVPKHFKYGFFIDGGALAVENALKTAIDWKVKKNFAKGITEERGHQVMHFKEAFHGRSGYTMSLTNTDPTKTALFPKFNWPRISNPYLSFPLTDEVLQTVIQSEKVAVEQIKQAFRDNPDDICSIIIEPIQGEGGDNHFRTEFMQQLRELADANDALLIFDEVQTGVGICGEWWAHQAIGVNPDIMCFGKKMQVCGIIVSDRIDDVPNNVFHTSSRINSTWGGSLVDMVRSTKYLEIIAEENLVNNAKQMGKVLHTSIEQLAEKYAPGTISNIRGLGLYRAFDMESTEIRNAFLKEAYKNGILLVGSGSKSVRFRPALNITEDLISQGVAIIATSLNGLVR
ncbi:MAG: L-lysine 6-transaminase [Ignavibacteria bacterium]|nr:L-lysine 6-transaminase [Ignavibacteria bacterium]